MPNSVDLPAGGRTDSEALNYRVPDACKRSGASRTKLYQALKAGELTALKLGRTTLIPDAELRRWVATWPKYRPHGGAGKGAARD